MCRGRTHGRKWSALKTAINSTIPGTRPTFRALTSRTSEGEDRVKARDAHVETISGADAVPAGVCLLLNLKTAKLLGHVSAHAARPRRCCHRIQRGNTESAQYAYSA